MLFKNEIEWRAWTHTKIAKLDSLPRLAGTVGLANIAVLLVFSLVADQLSSSLAAVVVLIGCLALWLGFIIMLAIQFTRPPADEHVFFEIDTTSNFVDLRAIPKPRSRGKEIPVNHWREAMFPFSFDELPSRTSSSVSLDDADTIERMPLRR